MPATENVTVSESIRDTLAFMKGSKNFLKLGVKPNRRVYWNDVIIKPVREITIDNSAKEYDITPSVQNYFTNTRATTKLLKDNDKMTTNQILKDVGFYNTKNTIGIKSARMQDAIKYRPKTIYKIQNTPLPEIENVEDSSDLQGERVKTIIPFNIILCLYQT